MTNAEAIETLRANYSDACYEQLREAVNMAIETLKAQLHQESATFDTISLQAAIDALAEQMPTPYTPDGSHPADKEIFAAQEIYADCIETIKLLPSAQPDKTRIFVELIVEYPDPELCPYKEYRGKPYYSIKYIENGERYVGYGTYNPEVLSQYLKEYFMPSAQTERKKGKWIDEKINSYTSRTYCSECGNSAPFICVSGDYYGRNMHGETNKTKFCPNCGARMDGE